MSAPVTAAVAACAVLIGIPVLVASGGVVAGARAAVAADAAALAAADALQGLLPDDPDPCAAATRVAEANAAELDSCELNEGAAEARVGVTVRSGLVQATRQARAGPAAQGWGSR
ncbi:Rv3654c family TadE-like protein [Leucobacter albus]|uniref:Rv3654c family TadE-like protein n=1 Tax=Leucobacter albus TaxID=272210 RepID=A0ABW3TN71_9MICO